MFFKEYRKLYNDLEIQKFYAPYRSTFEYIKNNSQLEMGQNASLSTTLLFDVLSVEVNIPNKLIYTRV